jgi:hypothetical protein
MSRVSVNLIDDMNGLMARPAKCEGHHEQGTEEERRERRLAGEEVRDHGYNARRGDQSEPYACHLEDQRRVAHPRF